MVGKATSENASGTKDGRGFGDRDRAYGFGERLTSASMGPFTVLQFARLLCLRSHVQDGDRVPEALVLSAPDRFGLSEPVLSDGLEAPPCFDDNCARCQVFLKSVERLGD